MIPESDFFIKLFPQVLLIEFRASLIKVTWSKSIFFYLTEILDDLASKVSIGLTVPIPFLPFFELIGWASRVLNVIVGTWVALFYDLLEFIPVTFVSLVLVAVSRFLEPATDSSAVGWLSISYRLSKFSLFYVLSLGFSIFRPPLGDIEVASLLRAA